MGGQCHAPAALPPGKTRYPFYRRLGGPQGRSGRVRKISPPPGFDPRTFQPIASRYTDWAILAHIECDTDFKRQGYERKWSQLISRKYTSLDSLKGQHKRPRSFYQVPNNAHCLSSQLQTCSVAAAPVSWTSVVSFVGEMMFSIDTSCVNFLLATSPKQT